MKGRPMTLVTAQMSVSLDGYYAGPRQGNADTSDLQSWLNGPEAAGFFRVTRWAVDAEAWRQRLGFSGGRKTSTPTSSPRLLTQSVLDDRGNDEQARPAA